MSWSFLACASSSSVTAIPFLTSTVIFCPLGMVNVRRSPSSKTFEAVLKASFISALTASFVRVIVSPASRTEYCVSSLDLVSCVSSGLVSFVALPPSSNWFSIALSIAANSLVTFASFSVYGFFCSTILLSSLRRAFSLSTCSFSSVRTRGSALNVFSIPATEPVSTS